MFEVPPKFYELCRLCLSSDGVKLSIFEEEGAQRHFADKILTCLSIAVRISNYDYCSFIKRDHLYTTRTIVYASLRLRSSRVVTVVYLCVSLSLSLFSPSFALTHSPTLSLSLSLAPEALSRSLPRDSVSLLFVSL